MKIIREVDTNIVKYGGHAEYLVEQTGTTVKNSRGAILFVVCDMKTDTCDLLEVENLPEDFIGNKYKYENNSWELNPAYE